MRLEISHELRVVQERVQGLADMIGKEWVISEDLSSEDETDALNWDDSDIMCPVERRLSVRRKSLLAVDKVLLIVPFLNHFIVFVVTLSGCCFVSNVLKIMSNFYCRVPINTVSVYLAVPNITSPYRR